MEENKEEPETIIPEIELSDNKIVLKTKEIPLIINGEEVMITMKQLDSGKRRDITQRNLKTKFIGQQIQGSMDPMGFQIGILVKVIIKAPFEITEPFLSTFPDKVIDYLYSQYSDWMGDSKKKLD